MTTQSAHARIEVQTLKSSAAMQIPEAEWRGLRYERVYTSIDRTSSP